MQPDRKFRSSHSFPTYLFDKFLATLHVADVALDVRDGARAQAEALLLKICRGRSAIVHQDEARARHGEALGVGDADGAGRTCDTRLSVHDRRRPKVTFFSLRTCQNGDFVLERSLELSRVDEGIDFIVLARFELSHDEWFCESKIPSACFASLVSLLECGCPCLRTRTRR